MDVQPLASSVVLRRDDPRAQLPEGTRVFFLTKDESAPTPLHVPLIVQIDGGDPQLVCVEEAWNRAVTGVEWVRITYGLCGICQQYLPRSTMNILGEAILVVRAMNAPEIASPPEIEEPPGLE